VATDDCQDVLVHERLQALGVALTSEWDVLVFLYDHSTSLGTAAQLGRLTGYDKAEIAAALQKLEILGLIQRSRVSQGIRLYQFSEPPEESRRSGLLELMRLSRYRAGRLQLLKHLKRNRPQARRRRDNGLRLAGKDAQKWPQTM
jgi:hypothetical protein